MRRMQDMNISKIKKEYIQLLKDFVSFKTVSTDSAFKGEMNKAVAWISKLCKAHGFSVSLLKGPNTNPVVCASYMVNKKAKTVLVYGHYDVQPAQKEEGWKTNPFVLTKKDQRYVARGVVDNKGQVLAHMVAVFDAIKNKTLKYNVTFLIEGNEESGNPDLHMLLQKNKKLLKADIIVISDSEMVGTNPTLESSFRGGGNIRVVYKTSTNDRHSGLFGGVIPNAAVELAQLIAKLKADNTVVCEGFYEGVCPPTVEMKEQHERISNMQPIQELAGVKALMTERGVSPCEQIGLRPTLEVSGFSSGYVGTGFKNIIPAKAEARINVRTVYMQNTEDVISAVKRFIEKETPEYVDVEIEAVAQCTPTFLDNTHEDAIHIKNILEEVHGAELFHKTSGGSLPVVASFAEVFKKPIVMISLCNDDCNMHGVDENFTEYHIEKALQFTNRYWNNSLM